MNVDNDIDNNIRHFSLEALITKYNSSVYNKVLILDRSLRDRAGVYLPFNWYIIRTVPDLEEVLHITLTPEQLRSITTIQQNRDRNRDR